MNTQIYMLHFTQNTQQTKEKQQHGKPKININAGRQNTQANYCELEAALQSLASFQTVKLQRAKF